MNEELVEMGGRKTYRGRPRNRWQDEVRENGRIVGGEGWQEKYRGRPINRWQGEVREDGRIVGGEGWQEKVQR
jgi:hypothetical protein